MTTIRTQAALLASTAVLTLAAGCGTATAPTPRTSDNVGARVTAILDAKVVLARLTAANLGVSNGQVQDENTDPNHLIGRPHQYTSRASFDLPGGDPQGDKLDTSRGGSIEGFANETDAKARYDYLDKVNQAVSMFADYAYLRGVVIVRVGGKVKPSDAVKVGAVVSAL